MENRSVRLNSIGDNNPVDAGNFSILNVVAVFKYHSDVVDAPVIFIYELRYLSVKPSKFC